MFSTIRHGRMRKRGCMNEPYTISKWEAYLMNNPVTIRNWESYCVAWRKRIGFETSWDNFAEKCMLIVTEIAEAVEANRTYKCTCHDPDPSLSHKRFHDHSSEAEELADAMIRILDLSGSLGLDIESAMIV